MKFFDLLHPIWQAIGKAGNIILLSILWIVTSVPIVTIGASTTALNKKINDIFHGADYWVIQGYFETFKVSFKKTFKIWIGCIAVIAIILFDLGFLIGVKGTLASIIKIVFLTAAGFFAAFLEVVFHIAYREELEKEIVKKALLKAVFHFPKLICAVILQLVIILLCTTDFVVLLVFLPGILGCISYLAIKK